MTYEHIKQQAREACLQLLEKANLKRGSILVVGCSTSEVMGKTIGKGSDINGAKAIYDGIKPILDERGIYLAAQCCEHLNRCVITEAAAISPYGEIVNVAPQPKAGGSFATTVYENLDEPVAVETIKADAGMDIGDTLIGMHLKTVAVPVRIDVKEIGYAHLVCARTRPKFIGGSRAVYDDALSGGEIKR